MKKVSSYIGLAIYLVMMSSYSYAKETESPWVPLKEDTNYDNSDYKIREDVVYFELRQYVFNNKGDKQLTDMYLPYFILYHQKLSSLPKKLVKKFRKIPFGNNLPTDITISQSYDNFKLKVKSFLIKKDHTFWILTEEKDFLWLFDKIDTPAELYYFFKINNLLHKPKVVVKNSYQKTTQGYDVKQEQIEHKIDIKPISKYKEEHTAYDIYTTYIYHINENQTFSKKFVSRTRKNEKKYINDTTIHGDYFSYPAPLITIPLDTFLRNKNFIHP